MPSSLSSIGTTTPSLSSPLVNSTRSFGFKHNLHFRRFFSVKVLAMSSINDCLKMNLNEYMVTLEKPLGIQFGLTSDGKVFVYALKRGGNAERSRIVMVGDTLKKASVGAEFVAIRDYGDTEKVLMEKQGLFSLILERPFTPFPIHQLLSLRDLDLLFNRGHIPIATFNKNILMSSLKSTSEGGGNSGFVTFCSKFSSSLGWKLLKDQSVYIQSRKQDGATQMLEPSGSTQSLGQNNAPVSPLVCIFSEEESGDGEWGYGNFPLDEYVKGLDRAKDELYYNHSRGMQYSKVTEQIFVGSCIQKEADVETLSKEGITAILNFQSSIEAENWGINSHLINESCQRFGVLMINYPIRNADSFDMRKKLPFCVGLMLRLLKKNHHVFITCTTGFDRSPGCVIAYLHWVTDSPLNGVYNFITGLHRCKPDRPAIAWATWDLIAMVEDGVHDGPATHAVTFVWNGHEGEDVQLVGDFTGKWKEPMRASHKGGARYEVEVRLSQGKYYYKYIINGEWRHSITSPTERDERGNINNVIVVGDAASVRPRIQQQRKDANIVKVIERPLTENERFMLAKAARCVTFSVCPVRLAPK